MSWVRVLLGRRSPRRLAAIAVVGPLFLLAGCFPAPAPTAGCTAPGTPDAVPVMGCSRLTVDQIVSWFNSQSRPAYAASVPIDQLVQYFVNEGWDENVRGDIAFAQAIIETGWFSFPGIVPASANNFAGLGATQPGTFAVFPDAQTGVRAQIQHLRAYADATVTVDTLHHPLVDPRFDYVQPKGKAPYWNQFGNGIWAASSTYATSILNLYTRMLNAYGMTLG